MHPPRTRREPTQPERTRPAQARLELANRPGSRAKAERQAAELGGKARGVEARRPVRG